MSLDVGGIFLAIHHDQEGTKIAEIAARRPEYEASIKSTFNDCRGILNDVHEAFTNEIAFFVQVGGYWRFLTFVHRENVHSSHQHSALTTGMGSGKSGHADHHHSHHHHHGHHHQHNSSSSRQRGWFCVSIVFALHDPQLPLPPLNTNEHGKPNDECVHSMYAHSLIDTERQLSRWHPVVETLAAKLIRAETKQRFLSIALEHVEMQEQGRHFEVMKGQGLFSGPRNAFDVADEEREEDEEEQQQQLQTSQRRDDVECVSATNQVEPKNPENEHQNEGEHENNLEHQSQNQKHKQQHKQHQESTTTTTPARNELAWVLQGYLDQIVRGGGFLWEAMGNFMFVYRGNVTDPRLPEESTPRCTVTPNDIPLLLSNEAPDISPQHSNDLLLIAVGQYLAKARAQRQFPHVQNMAYDLRAQLPLVQEAVSVLAAAGFVRVCPGLPLSIQHWSHGWWCDIKLVLTQKFYDDARVAKSLARETLADFCKEKGRLDDVASHAAATLIMGPLLASLGGPSQSSIKCCQQQNQQNQQQHHFAQPTSICYNHGHTNNTVRGLAAWVRNFGDSIGCHVPTPQESDASFPQFGARSVGSSPRSARGPPTPRPSANESAQALVGFLATQLGLIIRYAFAQQWLKNVEE